MSDKVFLDSNVLIYLYSSDEPEKRQKALAAIDEHDCVTSTQALNEICNVFSKKWKLPSDQIKQAVDEISESCNIVLVDKDTIQAALTIKETTGYSHYDCLMLASAIQSGCNQIFSEDMQSGQVIDEKLKIVNIFI